MSLSKLYTRIDFENNTTPALNETNLNLISKAVDDIDDRVIQLGGDVLETVPQIQAYLAQADDLVEAMQTLSQNPPYIGANGNWYVWSTVTSSFVDSGVDASITVQIADITMLATGTAPYVTNTGTNTDPVFHLFIPQGKYITGIAKTSTSGLTDTYTITYSDNTTTTFNVVNGNGIASIVKTSTSGLDDLYTITMQDGTTSTFTVTNGRGIVSITKTATVGYTDTYTITYNDATTSEFYVHNGKSGSGSNITVTTSDPELFGRPVTITDAYGTTVTQNFNDSGVTRFDSVEFSGAVTVSSSTSGGYTATDTITLTYFGNYSATLHLWRASIDISGASELYGAAITVKNSNDVTVDTITLDNTGSGTFETFDADTYTLSFTYHGYSYSKSIVVSSNTTYTCDFTYMATISLQGSEEIYGYSVVIKDSNNATVDTITLDALTGTATAYIFKTGTFTFNFNYDGDAYSESLTISSGTTSYSVELATLKIVTWASGTDAQLGKMLDAHYAGKINIADYWSVGDERQVSLSAMEATGVGESHVAQTVTMVLMNAGGKTLANNNTCAFVVGQKNVLANGTTREGGYMNSSNTNSGGWKSSARRTWCNSVYYNAIPSSFRALLKQFVNRSGLGGGSSSGTEATTDWTALPAEIEVFGSRSYSVYGEGSQFKYYETSANRMKKAGDSGSATVWWERSPALGSSSSFCYVNSSGNNGSGNDAGNSIGLAPFFCI